MAVNGPEGRARHPSNANIHFQGFCVYDILSVLQPRLAASTGSACTSGIPEPSHVLRAIALMAMKQSLLSASASASAHVTQTLKSPLASLKRRWQDCQGRSSRPSRRIITATRSARPTNNYGGRRKPTATPMRLMGIVKLTKRSSIDPPYTGLQPVANPPCRASEMAVSLNLTIPSMSLRPGYSWSATTCGTRDGSGVPVGAHPFRIMICAALYRAVIVRMRFHQPTGTTSHAAPSMAGPSARSFDGSNASLPVNSTSAL